MKMKIKNLVCILLCWFSFPFFCYGSQEQSPGRGGLYLELGGRSDPNAIGGEVGLYALAEDTASFHLGVSLLAAEHIRDVFVGFVLGLRLQARSQISPFAGFGVFAGYSEATVDATNDGVDNDGDLLIDEIGEEKEIVDNVLATVYPEVGINLYLTKQFALSFSSRYHITTEGRPFDFRMFSFGILAEY